METKDFNGELMDYLYGGMTTSEKKEFEQKLAEDADLRMEYEALRSVRRQLDSLKDKEVMESFSAWGRSKESHRFSSLSRRRIRIFRPVTAVAASLIVLMLVAYVTNFSISVNNQGLYIGFENQQNSGQYLGADEVRALVRDEVDKSSNILLTRLAESENANTSKLVALENSLDKAVKVNESAAVTNVDLQKFFASAENKNAELMRNYLQLTTTQQQEYFKTMLTQFNDFVQDQRNEDLTIIRNSLIELKQSQDIQKIETNQMIASILTSVNKQ